MALEIVELVEGERTGAVAQRDGRRVAHILGRLDEAPSRGKHAWIGLGDHSLREGESPELYADLYAVAGDPWVARGHLTHFVQVPADDDVLRVWFALGFGQEQVHASAPARAQAPAAPDSFSMRRARSTDVERALGLADVITRHQIGPPVWSGLGLPSREEMRGAWAEFLADNESVILLAERGDDVLGFAATHPGDEPGVAHLPVAATRTDARGVGVGRALAEHALHRAHADGYHTVALDWRSTNLLASRFWLGRGFVPTHYRLRRDVQPYA